MATIVKVTVAGEHIVFTRGNVEDARLTFYEVACAAEVVREHLLRSMPVEDVGLAFRLEAANREIARLRALLADHGCVEGEGS